MGFSVQGEVRGVKDRVFDYKDQQGAPQKGRDVAVVLELAAGEIQEVKFSRAQLEAGLHDKFAGLKGKVLTLPVDISNRKGFLNVWLSQSFVFPAAAAPAPAAAAVVK